MARGLVAAKPWTPPVYEEGTSKSYLTMTWTGVESLRPRRAGSVSAIEPEDDFAPTNVVSGVRAVAVNFDGSTPTATLAKRSCPASRHSTARATTIRLIDILQETGPGRGTRRALHSRSARRGAERTSAVVKGQSDSFGQVLRQEATSGRRERGLCRIRPDGALPLRGAGVPRGFPSFQIPADRAHSALRVGGTGLQGWVPPGWRPHVFAHRRPGPEARPTRGAVRASTPKERNDGTPMGLPRLPCVPAPRAGRARSRWAGWPRPDGAGVRPRDSTLSRVLRRPPISPQVLDPHGTRADDGIRPDQGGGDPASSASPIATSIHCCDTRTSRGFQQ